MEKPIIEMVQESIYYYFNKSQVHTGARPPTGITMKVIIILGNSLNRGPLFSL